MDSHINKHCIVFHHVGSNELRLSNSNNKNISLTCYLREITSATMTHSNRAVESLSRHKVGGWSTHNIAATYYNTVFAFSLDIIALEECADTLRCSRNERFLTKHHTSDVYRSESVNIFVRRDGVDDLLLIDMLWKRKLDNEAIDLVVVVEEIYNLKKLCLIDILSKTVNRREKTNLSAGFFFVCNVSLACAVITNEDGGQMRGTMSCCRECAHFIGYFVFNLQ